VCSDVTADHAWSTVGQRSVDAIVNGCFARNANMAKSASTLFGKEYLKRRLFSEKTGLTISVDSFLEKSTSIVNSFLKRLA
jgi:hypothetical protein